MVVVVVFYGALKSSYKCSSFGNLRVVESRVIYQSSLKFKTQRLEFFTSLL